MKPIFRFQALLLGLLLTLSIPAAPLVSAEENQDKTTFTVGMSDLKGYTKYTIGGFYRADGYSGNVQDPLSELVFSLDTKLATFGIGKVLDNGVFLRGNYSKNIVKSTGKMKDSDWGIDGDSEDTLSIYSESDSELDYTALKLEFYSPGYFKAGNNFYGGLNYRKEKMAYKISNVTQYSPSGLSGYDATVSGPVLNYEIDYTLLFAEAGFALNFENFAARVGYQASLVANAVDKDDHLLRSKTAEIKADGKASVLNASLTLFLNDSSFLECSLEKTQIDLEGTQNQYYNGVWLVEIDSTIKSEQTKGSISLTMLF